MQEYRIPSSNADIACWVVMEHVWTQSCINVPTSAGQYSKTLQEWNQHGVKRMSRMLTVLQPPLSSLGSSPETQLKGDASKPFDRARAYFGLLMCSPEALTRAAADHPAKFTLAEYTALLQVSPEACILAA